MAGTAGSGGLGALAIGGIASVAVVIGGVVLMQFGVFKTDPPVVNPVETAEQVTQEADTSDVTAVTDPANTNAQVGDEDQTVVSAPSDGAQGQTTATVDVAQDVAQTEAVEQTDTIAVPAETVVNEIVETPESTETAESAETVVTSDDQVVETVVSADPVVIAEAVEEIVEAPEVDTPLPDANNETDSAAVVTENSGASTAVSETVVNETVESEQVASETVASDAIEQGSPDEKPEEIVTAALTQPVVAAPETVEETAFVLTAPELDLVRFDADGAGLIAGRAQAGVEVQVLLDGIILDRFEVQNGGEFVSFSSIDPSTEARVVSLLAAFNGQSVMSDATFILAPSAAVDAVAPASEQPQVMDVAQANVTPDVQNENATDSDASTAAASVEEVVSSDGAIEQVAEVPQESEDPVEEAAAEATDKPAKVAEAEDDPVEAVEIAAVVPKLEAQPVTETAPKPTPEPVAMAVLKSDSEGVALVQPATPVAPELLGKVSLDIISYSDAGDVQLAGRAGPDSLVRVYLDNSPVADIHAAKDGSWKGLLSDIVPGIYTLRLDELDAEGKVLSRLETPFKREAPEVLQRPAAPEASPAQAAPPIRAVTVQKGDTLWAISRERYGDGLLYVRVFEANQESIRDPDLIYPGQIFSIPE